MSDNSGLPTGKHTLVEEGTEFKGTLSSKCPIVVMGKVEGEVAGPVIHVTASGAIAGNVKVKELRSAGEVAGEVEADAVRISGKVKDGTKIRARTLEVSLSSTKGMEVVFGECELAVGDEPNKEAAIAAATTAPAEPAKAEPPKPAANVLANRRRGPSETWDDGKTTESPSTDEEAKRRNRGTQPPV
jgi:cytoskeletal protein CcmA (bactofilin family)